MIYEHYVIIPTLTRKPPFVVCIFYVYLHNSGIQKEKKNTFSPPPLNRSC